jgi:hypothetical protein
MLHTRTHKSRMAIKNERLMSGYTGCIGCKHELLCDICPYWDDQSGTKMAERISATIGQENITRPPTREMLNKNK